jgi:hypothetical protein
MLGRMARWGWVLFARWPRLACLLLFIVAVPVAVHAEDPTTHFDIKVQPLSEALMAFGAQTGAIVMASSELTTGKICKPVTGQLTPQEALTRMLQGTGLKFEMSANGTILIVRTTPLSR